MNQRTIVFITSAVFLGFTALGCGYIESQTNSNTANKSIIERAEEAVFGNEKTGIPECDAILVRLDSQPANANESTLETGQRIAVKRAILAVFREKTGVANLSPQDKKIYAARCQEIYQQFVSASPTPAK